MATRAEKLDKLAEIQGLTVDEVLAEASVDSVVQGICVRDGCDYTTDVEPDCRSGYCEECRSQTVKSSLVLAGII